MSIKNMYQQRLKAAFDSYEISEDVETKYEDIKQAADEAHGRKNNQEVERKKYFCRKEKRRPMISG